MFKLTQNTFSLYALVEQDNVSSIFAEQRTLLSHWCKGMEKAVIERQLPVDVLAGFQRIGQIKPVLARYHELNRIAHSLTVFGQPDATFNLEGIHFVALDKDSPLVQEWFLIIRHPEYMRALIAREEEANSEHFRGVLTSDPAQVEQFYAALSELLILS
jgi:DICT domain-containing protein